MENGESVVKTAWATFWGGQTGSLLMVIVLIMFLAGLALVWSVLRRKDDGFGPQTVRALGIVLFLPILLGVTAINEFPGEAVAALLGTLAGYVFASGKDS
ncbi:hypothetical protein [Celeribacter naphthalenivorans]|uniref:hypothetical protein n=1 Tax=Celeribacter naphthalenivorans TaxID=1614694 RepID=UPI001CF965A6|nr:hypothetical protein [Celeribacter naphthalenivorans]